MHLHPLILAAGRGTRMRSKRPKVLQEVGGRPMLAHVLDCCATLRPQGIKTTHPPLLVIGTGAQQVRTAAGNTVQYIEQTEQRGTGHAVATALAAAPQLTQKDALVLILYGDVPLTRPATLEKVAAQATTGTLSLLTAELPDPTGYGRILRIAAGPVAGPVAGTVEAIIEHRDATPTQRKIREINTGIMALPGPLLKQLLTAITPSKSGELYLTAIAAAATKAKIPIATTHPKSIAEILGANDRHQLAALEAAHRRQQADKLLAAGATLIDPARIDIRGQVQVGQDVHLDANLHLAGRVILGDNVQIEPNCVLIDTEVAAGAKIRAFSHLEGAKVGPGAVIGPYARLRPGSEIGPHAKVGNFVETKNTRLGPASKANHLAYLGDTDIGRETNIGAGTITCNYDGTKKHRTQIADRAFIGSNAALVAPVAIGPGATIAAGSVITRNVPPNTLAVTRPRQKNIADWQRQKSAKPEKPDSPDSPADRPTQTKDNDPQPPTCAE